MGNIYGPEDNFTWTINAKPQELVLDFSWAPITGPLGVKVQDKNGAVSFDRKYGEGPRLKLIGGGLFTITVCHAGAKYGGSWHCEYYN